MLFSVFPTKVVAALTTAIAALGVATGGVAIYDHYQPPIFTAPDLSAATLRDGAQLGYDLTNEVIPALDAAVASAEDIYYDTPTDEFDDWNASSAALRGALFEASATKMDAQSVDLIEVMIDPMALTRLKADLNRIDRATDFLDTATASLTADHDQWLADREAERIAAEEAARIAAEEEAARIAAEEAAQAQAYVEQNYSNDSWSQDSAPASGGGGGGSAPAAPYYASEIWVSYTSASYCPQNEVDAYAICSGRFPEGAVTLGHNYNGMGNKVLNLNVGDKVLIHGGYMDGAWKVVDIEWQSWATSTSQLRWTTGAMLQTCNWAGWDAGGSRYVYLSRI